MKLRLISSFAATALIFGSPLLALESVDVQFDLKGMASKSGIEMAQELNRITYASFAVKPDDQSFCQMTFSEFQEEGSNIHVFSSLRCEPKKPPFEPGEELSFENFEKLVKLLSENVGIQMDIATIIREF